MNFASPYVELPKKLTVLENLKVYAMMYEVPDTKNRIEQLVEELNLAPILNKKTGELSSGQRNRVSLPSPLLTILKFFYWTSLQQVWIQTLVIL